MKALSVAILVVLLAVPAAAAPINVALGKPVTITGEVGVITQTWPPGPVAALDTIVDGAQLPAGTQWQTGTVWWDERHAPSANNIIEIDLLGLFRITDILIQADNNDSYAIYYRDQLGDWVGYATATPFGGAGMQTRAGTLGVFFATGIRIDAFDGDQFYSVSEFQANGTPVPEPATLLLFAAGAGAAAARRRFRKANVS